MQERFELLGGQLEVVSKPGEGARLVAQAPSVPAQAPSLPAQTPSLPAQAPSLPAQAPSLPVIPAQAGNTPETGTKEA